MDCRGAPSAENRSPMQNHAHMAGLPKSAIETVLFVSKRRRAGVVRTEDPTPDRRDHGAISISGRGRFLKSCRNSSFPRRRTQGDRSGRKVVSRICRLARRRLSFQGIESEIGTALVATIVSGAAELAYADNIDAIRCGHQPRESLCSRHRGRNRKKLRPVAIEHDHGVVE